MRTKRGRRANATRKSQLQRRSSGGGGVAAAAPRPQSKSREEGRPAVRTHTDTRTKGKATRRPSVTAPRRGTTGGPRGPLCERGGGGGSGRSARRVAVRADRKRVNAAKPKCRPTRESDATPQRRRRRRRSGKSQRAIAVAALQRQAWRGGGHGKGSGPNAVATREATRRMDPRLSESSPPSWPPPPHSFARNARVIVAPSLPLPPSQPTHRNGVTSCECTHPKSGSRRPPSKSCRALRISSFGPLPLPQPAEGELLVALGAPTNDRRCSERSTDGPQIR